jgi:hypothetical protein
MQHPAVSMSVALARVVAVALSVGVAVVVAVAVATTVAVMVGYGFLVLFPERSKFRTAELPGFLFYFSQVTFLLLNVFSP